MSDPRDALLEKFRANLRARVQRLRDMLEILGQVPDNEDATSQVLGELHTLKGEARLLGLVQLSELAHALETLMSHVDAAAVAKAEMGLDAMARALADQVSREQADTLIAATLGRFQESPQEKAQSGEEKQAAPASEQMKTSSPVLDATPKPDEVPVNIGASGHWVQVEARLIDDLCEAMAAISGDFGRIFAGVSQMIGVAGAESASSNVRQQGSLLIEECARFRTALDNATVHTWELRMVPAQPLLRELASHAQQLASAAGKEVDVAVEASGVQIERDALDKVWDAMIHLVRNSIDHGLEPAEERGTKGRRGKLLIDARTVGSSVTLGVSDDGRGIDAARVRRTAVTRGLLEPARAEAMTDDDVIQLVFERGFSTREQVSSLSGRGVGLDVVKARAESLGGRVDVHSEKGIGTRFAITLPFTLTKERLMVFELAGGLYGLPTQSIREVVGWRDLPDIAHRADAVIRVGGEPVPLRSLAELLGREPEPCSAALVVRIQEQLYALLVARILGERELIRRPAEPLLTRTTAIGASAMLEDGRLVLMLDLVQVGRHIRRVTPGGDSAGGSNLGTNPIPRILLVDDSPVIREMVSEILVSAGLKVTAATDGEEALLRIAEQEPDLVVSDIEMPRMDGFTLLEQIRKRSQRLPVVMLTTRASVQDRQRATTLGANAYVLKADFKSAVLLDVIQRFVPLHR
ncbi:MAG TPA: response regulator [Polyangiaceae bacterium]|nr:response regulator [Polyangiaceae bacterium]